MKGGRDQGAASRKLRGKSVSPGMEVNGSELPITGGCGRYVPEETMGAPIEKKVIRKRVEKLLAGDSRET